MRVSSVVSRMESGLEVWPNRGTLAKLTRLNDYTVARKTVHSSDSIAEACEIR